MIASRVYERISRGLFSLSSILAVCIPYLFAYICTLAVFALVWQLLGM